MTTTESAVNTVTSTGITATAIIFFRDAITNMTPWLMASIPLILLDLDFGIKAAKHRQDKVRVSKAIRGTFGKVVEYFAWVCFAATASLAFGIKWIEWAVLGLVYANELASIIGNYLETKGMAFSFVHFYRWILKLIAGKAGEAMDTAEAEGIIIDKDGKARDKRGRYTKRR